eukprot:993974-Amphidinium_carterae.1
MACRRQLRHHHKLVITSLKVEVRNGQGASRPYKYKRPDLTNQAVVVTAALCSRPPHVAIVNLAEHYHLC